MNKKYSFSAASLKNSKHSLPYLEEIIKDSFFVHEAHLKKNGQGVDAWDFSIKVLNKMFEYALFEFRDDTDKQAVEVQVYYRFTSLCSLISFSQICIKNRQFEDCINFRVSLFLH